MLHMLTGLLSPHLWKLNEREREKKNLSAPLLALDIVTPIFKTNKNKTNKKKHYPFKIYFKLNILMGNQSFLKF